MGRQAESQVAYNLLLQALMIHDILNEQKVLILEILIFTGIRGSGRFFLDVHQRKDLEDYIRRWPKDP
ncbi:hypothetical protein AXF42_Ash019392 [Apostasia shenzhenica]|uniref:Uncharacterized protein n=1 Tax=Apostasia shenzhenica TaxID=1088818 RepID=A0A2I0B4U9_9ASPA|nr:hypothetical protein AXF42_Ash019392 [Apostasia shenzhenica]